MANRQVAQLSPTQQVGLALLKGINMAYDVATLPLYTALQAPWKHWQDSRRIFARPTLPEDPHSPWVREHFNELGKLEHIETMDQLIRQAIKDFPDKDAMGTREVFGEEAELQKDGKCFKKLILGDYKWITYTELERKIEAVGRGLMALGLRPRQNVVILAETRQEWMVTAQACLRLNIPVVTLYATLGEEGIVHGINETESEYLVTSQDLLPKLQKLLPKMPTVKHIVYMENPLAKVKPEPLQGVKLLPYSQLEELGETTGFDLEGETPTPDDVAIIMYTSGSTGVPKGVMITQGNIVATTKGFYSITNYICEVDVYIAYLPLAHVLELACESLSLALGARVGYSSPLTLTDKSTGIKSNGKGDATLLKPTIMVAVPLMLDRVRKSITEVAENKGIFAKSFFHHVIGYKTLWQKLGYGTPILDSVVFNKMKALLGGRLKVIPCGSAPLSCDTHEFIKACLGCDLVSGYGLTETAAGGTIMDLTDKSYGRVGAPMIGNYIKLEDWAEGGYYAKDKPNPRGEIVVGGASVTKGYYKNDALTQECFREEGGIRWFYTGDIGEMYPDGTIKIIDRKKDLVKLQFGEYVSLGKIETELKTCPLVDNICVYGSSFHTFLIALIAPNQKVVMNIAASLNKNTDDFRRLCRDPDVIRAAIELLSEHGKKANLAKTEIPTKIKLCTEEWHPDSGLVTAAFKIRRKQIQTFYQADIDDMYSPHGSSKGQWGLKFSYPS